LHGDGGIDGAAALAQDLPPGLGRCWMCHGHHQAAAGHDM